MESDLPRYAVTSKCTTKWLTKAGWEIAVKTHEICMAKGILLDHRCSIHSTQR